MKLRQSTAITIQIGPFLDSTDGVTPETGLTIAQADARLSKAGAAFAQKGETSSGTHDENGFYRVAFNATDTGTVGKLIIAVFATGAVPVWHEFEVVPANVYDSLVAGADTLNADITQVTGTSVTDVDDFKADVSALATATALTTVDTNVDAILVDTGATLPAQISALNDLSQAEANAACDQALADYDGPTNAEMEARTLPAASYGTAGNQADILDDTGTDIPAQISGLNDISTVEAQAAAAAALSAYDPPTNSEMEARTILADNYFDPSIDEVTTDSASREASKADVSGLSTFDPDSDTVDIGKVNGVTVDGAGTEADPWGPV